MRQTDPTQQTNPTQQQDRPTKQQDKPTKKPTNPTDLILKLVTGDTHRVRSPDTEAVINSVGDTSIAMIAFHDAGRRVYIPCRAIVSMVETVNSDTQPPFTWNVDR